MSCWADGFCLSATIGVPFGSTIWIPMMGSKLAGLIPNEIKILTIATRTFRLRIIDLKLKINIF